MGEKHGKAEYQVGPDQWVIRPATAIRPEVAEAFADTRRRLYAASEELYAQLRESRDGRGAEAAGAAG